MKCSEIQEQLSAYHDEELNSELRADVAAHVADCDDCASQLAEFASYSSSFRRLPQPEVPPTVWAGISEKLDQPPPKTTVTTAPAEDRARSRLTGRRLALAASALLMLGMGLWMSRHSNQSDPHLAEFAMTMDHYLKTLENDPDRAVKFLLEKYEGQTVDPEDAIQLVGYRPAVASGLPDEYTLASTAVMKMPCCTCVKSVCKRSDGSTLVLFEHDDERTDWFGKRPSTMATCRDKECCLIDLDSSIAATWKRGSRWVTAVGARDTEEVSDLINWLESKNGSTIQSL